MTNFIAKNSEKYYLSDSVWASELGRVREASGINYT